jgi:signal transduction histidine kinase
VRKPDPIAALRRKLRDAEDALAAIRGGKVDALLVADPSGRERIYTLKGADEPYRVLVESMNAGALTLNGEGVILYCNAQMAALAGCPLERMMGGKFSAFLLGGRDDEFEKLLGDASGPRTLKLRLARGAAPVQFSMTPLDLGGTRAFCAVVTDLTEVIAMRKTILHRDASLRLVAESAPAVLFTTDSSGRVLSAAGAALKSIGGRVDRLLDAPVVGPRNRVSARSQLKLAIRAGKASYDASYANRLWNVNLERWGVGGVIGIAVDVTGQRHERSAVESARREDLQRDYVANVSHEFLTPLTAIRGYAEALLGGALDDGRHARAFVCTIERHTVRLTELVENLLYLSTMESGGLKPDPQPIDLVGMVRDMLRDLRPLCSLQKVAVKVSVPKGSTAYADPAQLRRVFMNVVANGIKYNRRGGKLSLSAKQLDGHVVFVVADTGIGIKAAELPLIFDRFHRAKNARHLAIKGTGLGLSIAKMLVEHNKGRIWAESKPGKGTRFSIQLPSRA